MTRTVSDAGVGSTPAPRPVTFGPASTPAPLTPTIDTGISTTPGARPDTLDPIEPTVSLTTEVATTPPTHSAGVGGTIVGWSGSDYVAADGSTPHRIAGRTTPLLFVGPQDPSVLSGASVVLHDAWLSTST